MNWLKRYAASMTALALMTMVVSQPLLASGAQLEGLVIGLDRTPAGEHRVHLIDDTGREVATAATDRDGVYAFENLPQGAYSLAIADDAGRMAPVAGEPVRLGSGELSRRDITLVDADAERTASAATSNYGLGVWWAGLTGSAKVWTIVGIVGVTAITAAAVADDDDDPPASAFLSGGS